MNSIVTFPRLVGLAAGLAAVVGVGIMLGKGWNAANAGEVVITPAQPAQFRVALDPAKAVSSGPRTFLTLDVTSYTPPPKGGAAALVRIVAADGERRRDIGRISIFPDKAFVSSQSGDPHIFRFPVSDCDIAKTACDVLIEVEFVRRDEDQGKARLVIGNARLERE